MATVLIEKISQGMPDTPEIKIQCEVIRDLGESLQNAKMQLEGLITEVQAKCEHNFQKVRQFEVGDSYPDKVTLLGCKCKKCFLFRPRRNDYWEPFCQHNFCEQCGTEMHFVEQLSVEGSDRHMMLYACSQCGHESAVENTG